MLFNGVSVLEVLPDQQRRIKEKVQSLEGDYILSVSEDDLIKSIVDEFTLSTPVLDEPSIHVEHEEEQIDVSQDPMRMFYDRSGPFYVPGTRLTFILPFSGDPNLFEVQPQGFTWSTSGSRAEVAGDELHFTYSGANLDANHAKREFDNELRLLKQNLENLQRDLGRHNDGLSGTIRQLVQQRKQRLLDDAKMVASLGFPIRRRADAPTYSVPVRRKKPKIERPAPPKESFQPEPALGETDYEEILGIIRNMVRVMEQSPKAFEEMGEENLRTHFLVQLNGQYEGRATGETFNFQGKTDILIREEGKNVFIAECKFWSGEKQFLETIDQLLSYLSWRDTKAAVLVFSRNANFTEVLKKIEESVPNHPNHKRTIAKMDESTFRYIFHLPNDPNRELTITVLAFDIPRPGPEA